MMRQENETRPAMPVQELLVKFGGPAMEQQLALAAVISGREWTINLEEGTMNFGPGLDFSVQVLGAFLYESGQWAWSWDTEYVPTADPLLQQARLLRRTGEEYHIELLRQGQTSMTTNGVHLLGVLATGLLLTQGYYFVNFGEGLLLVVLHGGPVPALPPTSSVHLAHVLTHLMAPFDFNHRRLLASYAADRGYEVTQTPTSLRATRGEEVLTAEFDAADQLTSLNGQPLDEQPA